jgi:hypothetical protein
MLCGAVQAIAGLCHEAAVVQTKGAAPDWVGDEKNEHDQAPRLV